METGTSAGFGGTVRPKTPDHQLQVVAALSPPPTAPLNKSPAPYGSASEAHDDAHNSLTAKPPTVVDTSIAFQQTEHSHDPEQILVQSVDSTAETSSTTKTQDTPDAEAQSHPVHSPVDCRCHICRDYVHLAQKLLKKLDDEESESKDDEDGQHLPECLCRKCLATKLRRLKKDPPVSDFISYAIEYRDSGNYLIKKEPWPHALDLAASRILPGAQFSKGATVFSVTTILATSIPANPDRYWTRWEANDIMEDGILQNPGVRVVIKGTRLRIHSRAIMNALRSVVAYYPDVSLWQDEVEVTEPFCIIAHHLDDLKTHQASLCYAKEDPAFTESCEKLSVSQASEHLSMFLKYIEGIYKGRLEQEKERYKRGMCTFHMLWYLYKPGATVYGRDGHGNLSALVIRKVEVNSSILHDPFNGRLPIIVHLWHLDYNGQKVGRCSKVVKVFPFDGEEEILTLDILPCEYQDNVDGGKSRADLIKYGRRWYKYLAVDQMQYSGRLWNSGNREVSDLEETGKGCFDLIFADRILQINGRVVSDWNSYWEHRDFEGKAKYNGPLIDKLEDVSHHPISAWQHASTWATNFQCSDSQSSVRKKTRGSDGRAERAGQAARSG